MNSIDKKFSIDEAVKIISDEASKKFVEAIDVAVNLGIDPVKTDQAVREQQIFLMEMEKPIKLQFLPKAMKLKKQKIQELIGLEWKILQKI